MSSWTHTKAVNGKKIITQPSRRLPVLVCVSWLYDTWRKKKQKKMSCGYQQIKKKKWGCGGGAGWFNIHQWLKGLGDGVGSEPMDEGQGMKEEINQRYNLHRSLVNHRPQRFTSLWWGFCCRDDANAPKTKTELSSVPLIMSRYLYWWFICQIWH